MPAYNAELYVADSIKSVLDQNYENFELLIVDDGSTDNSWQVICDLAGRYPQVRGLNLMRNFGQHNALLAGIRSATGEFIVTMDDDLQNPPEEVPKLLEKLAGTTTTSPRDGLWK